MTLRRWDPTTGSVSTVTPALNSPVGISGSTTDGWFSAENPATELPNFFNADVVASIDDYIGVAIHNDWMYLFGNSRTNVANSVEPWSSSWLRRIDMNNPSGGVETLYYALERPTGLAYRTPRDHLSDFVASPEGVPWPTSSPTDYPDWAPGLGTPQLYGFSIPATSMAAVVGDSIVFNNDSTRTFVSGWQIFSEQLCAFDIPALLQAVAEAGGPIRHNREQPNFYIVANGTANDHSYTDHNWKSRWAVWQHIDGGTPAFTHVSTPSLIANEAAPGWAGKVLFMSSVVDDSLAWSDYVYSHQGHVIKVLERKGSAERDFVVEFSFEGAILKSYGAAAGILPPEAPEEIILS